MESLKFDKKDLIKKIKKNREKHEEIFLEAMEGYREKMIEHLDGLIKDVKANKDISHSISLVKPKNNLKDYDLVISMLDATTQDSILLDSLAYQSYVLDDWNWKKDFLHSNVGYSKKAVDAFNSSNR